MTRTYPMNEPRRGLPTCRVPRRRALAEAALHSSTGVALTTHIAEHRPATLVDPFDPISKGGVCVSIICRKEQEQRVKRGRSNLY